MAVDFQHAAGLEVIFSRNETVCAHCRQVGECPWRIYVLVLLGPVRESLRGGIRSWGWGVCVCVWRVLGVRGLWGGCLIIYLYNLQKMGLVEREWGAVFWKPPWESWRSRVVFFSYQQMFLSGNKKLIKKKKNTVQFGSSVLILRSSDSSV